MTSRLKEKHNVLNIIFMIISIIYSLFVVAYGWGNRIINFFFRNGYVTFDSIRDIIERLKDLSAGEILLFGYFNVILIISFYLLVYFSIRILASKSIDIVSLFTLLINVTIFVVFFVWSWFYEKDYGLLEIGRKDNIIMSWNLQALLIDYSWILLFGYLVNIIALINQMIIYRVNLDNLVRLIIFSLMLIIFYILLFTDNYDFEFKKLIGMLYVYLLHGLFIFYIVYDLVVIQKYYDRK